MNKVETKIDDGFKPRTWLLVILIVLGIVIAVFLTDQVVIGGIKKMKIRWTTNRVNNTNTNVDETDDTDDSYDDFSKDFEISSFNTFFEMFAGTQHGSSVIYLLDKVITNNKTKKDHIISVTYNGVTTQDEEQIRSFKANFDNWSEYEVILDYDQNGFVNSVTVR